MSKLYGVVVHTHDLRVDDEVSDLRLDGVEDVLAHVGVLRGHVLQVSRVDGHLALVVVDLASQAVVLVLAGEWLAFESREDDADLFGWLREHRLAGHPRCQETVFVEDLQVSPAVLHTFDDELIVRELMAGLSECCFPILGCGFEF